MRYVNPRGTRNSEKQPVRTSFARFLSICIVIALVVGLLPSFSFLALGNMGGEGEGEDIITVPEDPTGDDPGIIAPLDIELVYAPALINFWLLDEDGNAPTDPSQTVTKEVVVGQTAYASWYSNTYTPEGYAYNENSDLNKNEYAEVTVGGVTLNLYYHLVVEGSTEGEEGEEGGEEPIVVDPIALYTIVFDFGAGSNLAPLVIQVFENGKTIGDFLSEGVPTGPVAPKSSIYTFTGWSPSWNLTDTITSSMVFVAQWTQSIPNTSGHGWNTVLGTANFQNYSIPGNAIELTFEGVSSSGQTTLDHAYMIVNDDGSLTLLFLAWSSSKDFNNSGSFMDYAGIKGTMKAYYKKDNKNMYAAFELTIPASMIYSIATQVQRINIVNEGSPGHSVVDAPLRFLNINIMTEHYIYDPAIGVESATLRITVPGVGIIGSPFTAKPLYFYGYVYDEGNPLSATSGIVTESGTLILKLYYYKTGDYLWKITGTSATTTYNNASQSLTSVLGPGGKTYTIYLPGAFYTFEGTLPLPNPTGTNAGTYNQVLTPAPGSYKIFINGAENVSEDARMRGMDREDVTFLMGDPLIVDQGALIINPRPATIQANNQTKIFGTGDPVLTVTTDGFLLPAHEPVYTVSRAPGEAPGTYPITFGEPYPTSQNYDINWIPGTLTIQENANLRFVITADSATYDYDANSKSLAPNSYSVTGDLAGFTVTATTSGATRTNAGATANTVDSYTIIFNGVDVTYLLRNSVACIDGALTINRLPATITANNEDKLQGTPDPASWSAVTSGFLSSSDIPTYSLTRVPGETVGEYEIGFDLAPATDVNKNYDITYVPGTLTIDPNPDLRFKISTASESKVYNGATQSLGVNDYTYTVNIGFAPVSDGFLVTATTSGAQMRNVAEGPFFNYVTSYHMYYNGFDITGDLIKDDVVDEETGNVIAYAQITEELGILKITPKDAKVIAGYSWKYYLDSDARSNPYSFEKTLTYEGFVTGEDPAPGAFAVTRTGAGTSAYEDVNLYEGALVVVNSSYNDSNYKVELINGDFEILKKSIDITLTIPDDLDAEAAKLFTKVYGDADANIDSICAVIEARLRKAIMDKYGLTATEAADFTVSIGKQNPSGVISREPGQGVGTYEYYVNVNTTGNYETNINVSAWLTITRAPLTITSGSKTFVFSGSAYTFDDIQIVGLVNGDAYGTLHATGSITTAGQSPVQNAISETGATYVTSTPAKNPAQAGVNTITDNYIINYVVGELRVIDIGIAVDLKLSKVYGDADPTLASVTAQLQAEVDAQLKSQPGLETLKITVKVTGRVVNENAGGPYAYTVELSYNTSDFSNNAAVSVKASLTITPRPVEIFVQGAQKIYGENDPAFDGMIVGLVAGNTPGTPGNTADFGTVTYYRSNAASENNAGTYPNVLTAEYSSNPNFTVTLHTALFRIVKKDVTITLDLPDDFSDLPSDLAAAYASLFTKVYAEDDPALANIQAAIQAATRARIKALYPDVDTNVIAVNVATRTAGENVGSYPYAVTVVDESGNYNLSCNVTAALTITQREVSITVHNKSKEYGDLDPILTGTVAGLLEDSATGRGTIYDFGTPRYSRSNTAEDAGVYPNVLVASYTDNANYKVTVTNGALTINKKRIDIIVDVPQDVDAITARLFTKVYGEKDPAIPDIQNAVQDAVRAYITWMYGSQFANDFTVKVTGRAAGENIGTYAYDVELIFTGNYELTNTSKVTASLTITKRAITITVADSSKTFGDPDPAFTGTVTGLVEGGAAGAPGTAGDFGTVTYHRIRSTGDENVGAYAKTLTANHTTSSNYAVTVINGDFVINPRPLTITVNDASKIYGDPDPAFTGTVEGLVGTDTAEIIKLSYYRVNDDYQDVSIYNSCLVPDFDTDNTNYIVTVISRGRFIITPREITIAANDGTWTFTGETFENKTSRLTKGSLAYKDAIESVVVTGSQTQPGSSANVASAAVILADSGKDVTANYKITYVNGTLTVKSSGVVINFTAATGNGFTKIYGENDPDLVNVVQAQLQQAVNELLALQSIKPGDVVVTVESRIAGEDVTGRALGSGLVIEPYAYIINWEFVGTGYELPGDSVEIRADLSITPREITITAASASRPYDATPLRDGRYTVSEGGIQIDALPFGDAIAQVTVRGSQTDVGTSRNRPSNAIIMGEGLGGGLIDVTDNYSITYQRGNLTITQKDIEVILDLPNDLLYAKDAQLFTKVYGQDDPDSDDIMTVVQATVDALLLAQGVLPGEIKVNSLSRVAGENVINLGGGAYGGYPYTITLIDTTGNYNLSPNSKVSATMTITKATLTLTSFSDGFIFDEDMNEFAWYTLTDVAVDGLQWDDTYVGAKAIGKIREVGSVPNAIDETAALYTAINGGNAPRTDIAVTNNYIVVHEIGTLTVKAAGISINLTAAAGKGFTKVYGDVDPSWADVVQFELQGAINKQLIAQGIPANVIRITVTGREGDSNLGVSGAYGENVGLYNYNISISYAPGYGPELFGEGNVIAVAADLTITPKPLTIIVNEASKIFGEDDPTFSGTVIGLVGTDTMAVEYYRSNSLVEDAGTYSNVLNANYESDDNYNVTVNRNDFTIIKKEIEVNVDLPVDFDRLPPEYGYLAGDYASFFTKVYGDPDPSDAIIAEAIQAVVRAKLTLAYGAQFAKDVTVTVDGRVAGEGVVNGPYAFNIEVKATDNYVLTYTAAAELSITRAPLTVWSASRTFIWTGSAQSFDKTGVEGLVLGDTYTVEAIGSITGVGLTPNTIRGGAYVSQHGTNLTDNYFVKTRTGTLTVKAAGIAVSLTADADPTFIKVYGEADPTLATVQARLQADVDAQLITQGLSAGDIRVIVNGRAAGEDVKHVASGLYGGYEYAISLEYDPAIFATGEGVSVEADLVITPRPITITANTDAKDFDEIALTNSGYTYTAKATGVGLAFGDVIESVEVTGSQTIVGWSSNVPSDAVLRSASPESKLVNGNYTITYVNGRLTIGAKEMNIVLDLPNDFSDVLAPVYNSLFTKIYGQLDPDYDAIAAAIDAAVREALGVTVEGLTVTVSGRAAGENIGTYAFVVSVVDADDNYTINYTVSASLTIIPRDVTIVVDNDTKIFGSADPAFTGTVLGLEDSQFGLAGFGTVNYVRVPGFTAQDVDFYENVLTATYDASYDAAGSNYNVTVIPADFTITPKAVTIVVDDASKIYGAADPAFTGTVYGLVSGDAVALGTVSYVRTNDAEDVDTYRNVLTAVYTANKNYTVDIITGDFTIDMLDIAVELELPAQLPNTTDEWPEHIVSDLIDELNDIFADDPDAVAAILANPASLFTKVYGEDDPELRAIQAVIQAAVRAQVAARYSNQIVAVSDIDFVRDFTVLVLGRADGENVVNLANGSLGGYNYSFKVLATDNYSLDARVKATLTITKAPLTLWSASKTFIWTGEANTFDKTGTRGLQFADEYNGMVATGSIVGVGSTVNGISEAAATYVPTYTNTNGSLPSLADNYIISYDYGTLTIKASGIDIDFSAAANNSFEKIYGDADPDNLTVVQATLQAAINEQLIAQGMSAGEVAITVTGRAAGETVLDGPYAYTFTLRYDASIFGEDQDISVAAELIINPRKVTITVNNSTKIFGDDDPAFTGSVYGLVAGDPVGLGTVAYVRTNDAEDVGRYRNVLVATYTPNSNYTVVANRADFRITEKEIWVDLELPIDLPDDLSEWPEDITDDLAAELEDIFASNPDLAAAIMANPASLFTKIYGEADPRLAAVEAVLQAAVRAQVAQRYGIQFAKDFTVTVLDREAGQGVGQYSYVLTTEATGNYTLNARVGASITITKAPLVVWSASRTFIWDGNDHTLDRTGVNGLQYDDTYEGVVATGSILAVGAKPNTIVETAAIYTTVNPSRASLAEAREPLISDNYDITIRTGTLTVKAAGIAIDLNAEVDDLFSKVYGENDPSLAVITAALQAAIDEQLIAQGIPAGAVVAKVTGREEGEDVISDGLAGFLGYAYDIVLDVPAGLFGRDQEITVDASLTITPRPITITAADATQVYSGRPLTNSDDQISGDGIAPRDTLVSITNVGSQTAVGISANVPCDALILHDGVDVCDNYDITYVDGTLVVTPAPLVITVNGIELEEGSPIPDSYDLSVRGFVNGETFGLLGGTATYRTSYTSGASAGTSWQILLSGIYAANYQITFVPGTITVIGATAPIVPDPEIPLEITTYIEGELTPLIGVIAIADDLVPQNSNASWALVNLILAVVGILMALVMLIAYATRRKETEEEEQTDAVVVIEQDDADKAVTAAQSGSKKAKATLVSEEYTSTDPKKAKATLVSEEYTTTDQQKQKRLTWRIVNLVAGIIAMALFLLTEDIAMPMVLVDMWTILQAIILVLQIAFLVLSVRKKKEDKDEEGETGAEGIRKSRTSAYVDMPA